MKIQFALLSIILLSAFAVIIPSNANAQTNDITLTSVLGANICEDNSDCIKQLNSVHFADDKIGWVVGNSGVILYTTDGGTTWTEQTSSVTTALNSVHFADDKIGWVVGNSGVILYTTDGGTTWTEQTNSVTTALNSVHFADNTFGWVVGEGGVILHTTDGGTTWIGQTSDVTSTLQSVHFADNTFGWVVGEGGVILHTVNSGQAWTKQITNDTDFLNSVHFVDHNYGWAISSGNNASVFFTANGGTTWTEQTIPIGDSLEVLSNSVHFTNSNNGLIVGSYVDSADEHGVGFILYTTNGGVTWTEQTSNVPSNLRSVQFTDSNKALVVGGNGNDQVILHLTMPLGDTITLTPMNSINICGDNADCEQNLSDTHLQSVHFTDRNNGWIVGGSNAILQTTDGGNTWTGQTSTNGNNLNSVHFANNNGWAVGRTNSGQGVIQHTDEIVPAWTGQNIPDTVMGVTFLKSVHFADDKIGWAVGINHASPRGVILHTVNGGDTWIEQTSSVTTELRSVHFVNDKIGWVVGNSGVILYTTDGGTAWTGQTSTVTSTLHSVHFVNDKIGWVVGVNGVILHTTDGGTAWTKHVVIGPNTLNSVHFTDSNNGWIVGTNQLILYTVNGGSTWVDQTPSISSDILNSVHFTDRNNGWAVGDKAKIIHITVIAPDTPIITSQTTRTNVVAHIITGTAVEGSTVTLTQNNGVSTSTSTATTSFDGAWSVSVNLQEGANIFTATASEQAGNTSDVSNSVTVTLDTTAPVAPIITPPVTLTNENTITITGTAENGSTVTLTQNDIALTPTIITSSTGTWSIDVTLIQDANTFTATATDQAGNASDASTPVTVTRDTAPPAAPVIKSPASPETSTNEYTHKITGTAENDSTITLTQNITVLESVTVGSNGIWSIDVTLGYGTNIFTATASDQAGNTSKDSTSIMVIFDDTPPAAPVIKSPTPSTTDTAHTIDGTAVVGFPYVDSTITLTKNGAPLKSVPIGSDGTWSVSVTLREGENTFTATASDQAGNISDVSNSVTVTLDNTAPDAPTPDTTPPAAPVITPPTTLTNENTITITGTTVEGSTVTLIQNNIALTPTTITSSDGIWSVDVTLIQGDNTFTATATDQAGNISDVSNSVTVTLDNAAPIITLTGANPQTIELGVDYTELGATTDDGSEVSIDSSAYRNVVGTYIITYTATDGTNQATATRTVNVVDTTAPIITLTGANPQTIELGVDYTELGATTDDGSVVSVDSSAYRNVVGTYIITYTATDGTNQATATRTVNVVDTTAPAAPVITSPTPSTNADTHTIAGTAENGSTVTLTRNSVALVPTATTNSNGAWSIEVTLQEGANIFTATASDQAGNTSDVSNSVTVTLDNIAPDTPTPDTTAPTAPVITSEATSTNKKPHTITGTAENGSTVTLRQNVTVLESVTVGSNGAWSVSVTLGAGTNTFTATASDQAGNTSKDSAPIMVIFDNLPPAAPIITSEATSTTETAHTITGTVNVGYPDVDSTVTLTQNSVALKSVPIGSNGAWSVSVTLGAGTNTFTATASDQAGNISNVSDSVTITLDTTAPVTSADGLAHNQAQSPPQNLQTTSASIIKVHDGTKFVEFSDGMTINSGTPKFRGTSTGISSIQILLGDSQVGGNGVRSDGTFSKGWDNDPLADGTYTITVTDKIGDERKRILESYSIIIDKDGDGNPNAAITKVRVGTEYMPFEHGMTINSGTPKFKGTSTGISSIQILLGDSQVGGNKISSDGSFIKGWKGVNPLADGTYSLTVSDNNDPETILFTSYIIIDANNDKNPKNAQITKVRAGSGYMPFEHGMTINPETLKFRGTSAGIDSVKVMIGDSQVGGNNIRDNGIFAKGWKGDPLTDGKYSLTVSDNGNPETILFTSYIIIQNPTS